MKNSKKNSIILFGKIEDRINQCRKAIGRELSFGEKSDLIQDRFAEIRNSDHAHEILHQMKAYGYDV